MKIVFIILSSIIFASQLYANSCDVYLDEPLGDEDFISKCNIVEESSIKSICSCPMLKIKVDPTKEKTEYSKSFTKSYMRNVKEVVSLISNDLSYLGVLLSKTQNVNSKKTLEQKCSLERLNDKVRSCENKEGTYASLVKGEVNSLGNIINNYRDEFELKSKPFLNTKSKESCLSEDGDSGFIKRCSEKFRSDCNMSDNLSEELFLDKKLRDLNEMMLFYSGDSGETLEEQVNILADFDDPIFEKLETLSEVPFFRKYLTATTKTGVEEKLLLSKIKLPGEELSPEKLRDRMIRLLEEKEVERVSKNCESSYQKVEEFLCSSPGPSNEKEHLHSNKEFLGFLGKGKDLSDNKFIAAQYYCQSTHSGSKEQSVDSFIKKSTRDVFRSSVREDTQKVFVRNQHRVREVMCKDFYSEVQDKSSREKYEFFKEKIEQGCMGSRDDNFQDPVCDYLATLAANASSKVQLEKAHNEEEERKFQEAKGHGEVYVKKDFTPELKTKSFAQSILLSKDDKKEKVTKNKKVSPIIKKEKKVKVAKSTAKAAPISIQPQVEDDGSLKTQVSSPATDFSVIGTYRKKKMQDLKDRIAKINERLSKESDKPRLKVTNDKPLETKSNEDNFTFRPMGGGELESGQGIALSAPTLNNPYSGGKSASTSAGGSSNRGPSTGASHSSGGNPRATQQYNSGQHRYTDTGDRIEKSVHREGNSVLIDKFSLGTSDDGMINSLPLLTLTGEIEENLESILKKDEEKTITKDRLMQIYDSSQSDEFKGLAKMLERKERFLITKDKFKKIKLIVNYNSQTNSYEVEPFATNEQLKMYKGEYEKFLKNIQTAIDSKTFLRIKGKYSQEERSSQVQHSIDEGTSPP